MEIISLSEALDRAKLGKFNCILIIIGGLVLTSVLYETSGTGFILPLAQCDLDLTTSDKGLLGAIGYVGIITSSYMWGYLGDTKGRRAVMLPTLFGSFFVTLLSSLADRFWILLVLRFINGLLISGSSAAVYAYIDEFHVERTRSTAKSCFYVAYALGSTCMLAVAWATLRQNWTIPLGFITFKPWRLFLLFNGIPGLLAGIGVLIYPESPKFLLSAGKEKEAIEVIRTMQKWNNCGQEPMKIDGIIPDKDTILREPRNAPSKNVNFFKFVVRRIWSQTAPLFQKRFCLTFMLICIIQFWVLLITHGVYIWFIDVTNNVVEFMQEHPANNTYICDIIELRRSSIFAEEHRRTSCEGYNDRTFLYLLAVEVVFLLGFMVTGFIGVRVRRAYIFMVFVVFGICGVLTVLISNHVAALCMFVVFIGSGIVGCVVGGITTELYPTHLRGLTLSLSMMVGRMGGVFGSYAIGLLLETYCQLTFYISAGGLIVCGFLALLIPKEIDT